MAWGLISGPGLSCGEAAAARSVIWRRRLSGRCLASFAPPLLTLLTPLPRPPPPAVEGRARGGRGGGRCTRGGVRRMYKGHVWGWK